MVTGVQTCALPICGLGMYAENREDFLVKVDYYQEFCEKMGIPVIDDRIKEAFICYFDEVIKEQPGWA